MDLRKYAEDCREGWRRARALLHPLGFVDCERWKGAHSLAIQLDSDSDADALALQVADILNENGVTYFITSSMGEVEVIPGETGPPGEVVGRILGIGDHPPPSHP